MYNIYINFTSTQRSITHLFPTGSVLLPLISSDKPVSDAHVTWQDPSATGSHSWGYGPVPPVSLRLFYCQISQLIPIQNFGSKATKSSRGRQLSFKAMTRIADLRSSFWHWTRITTLLWICDKLKAVSQFARIPAALRFLAGRTYRFFYNYRISLSQLSAYLHPSSRLAPDTNHRRTMGLQYFGRCLVLSSRRQTLPTL